MKPAQIQGRLQGTYVFARQTHIDPAEAAKARQALAPALRDAEAAWAEAKQPRPRPPRLPKKWTIPLLLHRCREAGVEVVKVRGQLRCRHCGNTIRDPEKHKRCKEIHLERPLSVEELTEKRGNKTVCKYCGAPANGHFIQLGTLTCPLLERAVDVSQGQWVNNNGKISSK